MGNRTQDEVAATGEGVVQDLDLFDTLLLVGTLLTMVAVVILAAAY